MLTTRRLRRPTQSSLDSMRLALESVRHAADLDEAFRQVCVGAARVTSARDVVLAVERGGRFEPTASGAGTDRARLSSRLDELSDGGLLQPNESRDGDPMIAPLRSELVPGSLVTIDAREGHLDAFELFAEAAGALIDLHLLRARSAAAAHRVQPTDRLGGVLGSVGTGDGVAIVAIDDLDRVRAHWGPVAADSLVQAAGVHLLNATRPPGDAVVAFRQGQYLVVLRDLKAPIENVTHRLVESWRVTKPTAPVSIGAAIHVPGDAAVQTLERAEAALASAQRVGGDAAHVSPV